MSDLPTEAWWVRPPAEPAGAGAASPAATAPAGDAASVTAAAPATTTRLESPPGLVLVQERRALAAPPRRRVRLPALGALATGLAVVATTGWALAARSDGAPADRAPARDRVVAVDPATVRASASSTQDDDGSIDYGAANTLDGDPATAWNSNGRRDGSGAGMALTYTFAGPVELRSISLLNGYQKVRRRPGHAPVDLYPLNGRLHRVRVVTDAGSWTWDLADTRSRQTFATAVGRTRSLRLQVVSVYRSSTYPDLAVSEISFSAALSAR